jgi:hypothetical protein
MCGYGGSPCCPGDVCREWHFCGSDSTCQACGGLDETSCPGEACRGWLTYLGGQCVNPFALDPGTDIAICEAAEEGGADKSDRDWCYWHAAYAKGNLDLCQSIEWDAMREKCTEGEDPDDYYVISF